jgi:photosystem II stability/assembly factor-like uncharacterized protein
MSVIAIDPFTPATLFVGSRIGGLYTSADSGATWALVAASSSMGSIIDIVHDPVNSGVVYVTTGLVYKSKDGGVIWSNVSTGLPATGTVRLAIDPVIPTLIYATTGQGVYKTESGGE